MSVAMGNGSSVKEVAAITEEQPKMMAIQGFRRFWSLGFSEKALLVMTTISNAKSNLPSH